VTLDLRVVTIPDPDGHRPALALKGDWLVVAVGDGTHVGLGEASHSGDDEACGARVRELFERHARHVRPEPDAILALQSGPFATAGDMPTATAISALDQALWELAARRAGVPVWRLLAPKPVRTAVPVYVTINRALTTRDDADYRRAVERVVALGVRRVKVAPFEAVTRLGDQLAVARRGLEVLHTVRAAFPDVALRVDCHERFTPESALALLPELDPLALEWLEAPCPPGPAYAEIRRRSATPLAAGELHFGAAPFVELAACGRVDAVMPDVKHVGGFVPLVAVCEALRPFPVRVSPHNPSGDVATLASLHAAALAPNAAELELPLHSPGHEPVWRALLRDGSLHLPDAPGWGVTMEAVLAASGKGRGGET
jgi:galactonate dehydratase